MIIILTSPVDFNAWRSDRSDFLNRLLDEVDTIATFSPKPDVEYVPRHAAE